MNPLMRLCWMLLSLLPAACALTPPQGEPAQAFTLDPPPPSAVRTPAWDGILAVTPLTAAAPYRTGAMIYRRRANEFRAFARHRWQAPPARLLETPLLAALTAGGCCRAVMRGDPLGVADRRLDLRLEAFYQDFTQTPSRVRVRLRARLLDLRQHRLLAVRTLSEEVEAPGDDPYGGVLAYQQALARLAARLGDLIRGVEAKAPVGER